jgi:predicted secreted Zn-dependent protease
VGFKHSYDSQKGFKYSITCVFDKNSSWGRIKTDYILAHEQAHFDIAELYARTLYKQIKAYTFNSSTAQQDVPAMYRKIMKELSEKQQEYDRETDYSRNKEEQAAWLIKIRKELNDLIGYANYPQP